MVWQGKTMSVFDKAFMSVIRVLPRQALTMAAGKLAALPVPEALRTPIYTGFAKAVGANLEESAAGVATFPTFNHFFTRALVDGLRPWQPDAEEWAIPADGKLSACGRIQRGAMIQAKGIDYRVSDFLGEDEAAWEGARYATIYLSPADYHRAHWPTSGAVEDVRAMGGELWPVNGPSVRNVPGLFVENERTVSIMTDARGRRAAVVMVGATVVGGIELCVPSASTDAPTPVIAGTEHGRFYLGSTVVLVVQDREAPLTDATIDDGSPVQLGQTLWRNATVT